MANLVSRKIPRHQIATLLDEITGLTVYNHEPKDFGGVSPLATVHSQSTKTLPDNYANEDHYFWITLYWRRDDPGDTEDYLDDLARDVRQKLLDNRSLSGYWDYLQFDIQKSDVPYLLIDNVQYRYEVISVVVNSICGNT